MISYGKQHISNDDIEAVVEVLKSDYLTQGRLIKEFENDLIKYFGSKYACVVSSGTAALHLAGLALGWKAGDIIITTPISFVATANSIVYSGATPSFVDIDKITYTIDPNLVEEKIIDLKRKGKNIKALIGVDYAGHPCDWDSLRYLADKFNFNLINDNCHAMGASLKNDKGYASNYADIVTQSYHPVKHITTGEGGAILTNEKYILEKVQQLRTHGITKNSSELHKNDGPWYYEMHSLGFNYRITDFQCALGVTQLKKLDEFIKKRRILSSKYDKIFRKYDFIQYPIVKNNVDHAYHLYPILINFKKIGQDKRTLFEYLKNSGILPQVHYIPIHLHPFYMKNYGYSLGQFPIAEKFYSQELSLPIYPTLKGYEHKKVIDSIEYFFREL